MAIYYCGCDIAKDDSDHTVLCVVIKYEDNSLEILEEVVLEVKGKTIVERNTEYQDELHRIKKEYSNIKIMEG